MRDGLGGIQSVGIVGGTSDIGLAIARELRNLGAERFVLAGRDPHSMDNAGADLADRTAVTVDAADLASHQGAVEAMFSGGDLDVVVLAAGVLRPDPSPGDIAEMALANGAGSISLLAHLAKRLRAQGHGHLVVLSSMSVVRPRPSNYWYGASKAGLDFAARGLANDLEGSDVQVSIVRPGFVRSKMTAGMRPAPLACDPGLVGRAVAGAVHSHRGAVIWVPPTLRWLATLLRLLPRSLLARIDR
jgi:decaprenylphospho-beta-D-erythro-pentofuranosid-2-ulose 2-reductase